MECGLCGVAVNDKPMFWLLLRYIGLSKTNDSVHQVKGIMLSPNQFINLKRNCHMLRDADRWSYPQYCLFFRISTKVTVETEEQREMR